MNQTRKKYILYSSYPSSYAMYADQDLLAEEQLVLTLVLLKEREQALEYADRVLVVLLRLTDLG